MTAQTHYTRAWAVGDVKIYPVLTDVVGSAMTYGAAIDVFGAKAIAPTSNVTTAELWGDNQLLDIDTMLKSIDLQIDYRQAELRHRRGRVRWHGGRFGSDPEPRHHLDDVRDADLRLLQGGGQAVRHRHAGW